jgi:hydroxyethylthiazole kinase-like uncharacterized protein yjeF
MQKVYRSCYELDNRCYEAYGLTEDILMEHAAAGMANHIRAHFEKGSSVLIASGVGNNGADGIVLARQLHGDYNVSLYVPFDVRSPMAKLQLERAMKVGVKCVEMLEDAQIIVDALLGAGLNKPLQEDMIQVIQKLNSLKGYKIACDIPTGVGDEGLMPIAFEAQTTFAMGARNEALYLDVNKDTVGEVVCVDLGISSKNYEGKSETYVLEQSDLSLPSRLSQNSHKGSFGHAAVFCGEKEGAGIIAGMASASFGAGLTTLVVHEKVTPPPYLMSSTVVPSNATALAIGMGLGGYFEQEFLQKYVLASHLPIVLDADAFGSRELLGVLEQTDREIVITPHPKEFVSLWEILSGEELSVHEVQQKRFEMVRRFNTRYPHVTLLLKGANTLIMQEEQLYINPLGCAKLSKGGSGDVLAGLIAALLAQGHTGLEAAIQGSLTLAVAADNYEGATYAMLPTDIISEVSKLERN